MTVSRFTLFGALALASSILVGSFSANATTRHHRHGIHGTMAVSGLPYHRTHVLDAVARRQPALAHRSALLTTRNTLSAGHHLIRPA